jgi:outer membrane protein
LSLNIPLRNRAAQSDYATSLLELRQNQLNLRKNSNQVTVDVQNAVIGLQQARVRYDSASVSRASFRNRRSRATSADTHWEPPPSFKWCRTSAIWRAAKATEVQAMANYTHARISFDSRRWEPRST